MMTAPRTFLSTLTGSFATPAAENPTVAMVEAAYRHHGLDARYINCEIAPGAPGDAVRGARAMGWAGFNCSLPHKTAVIEYLDVLAPSAEIIGADPAGARIVLFGAGGAARAIAVESALAGAASVTVVNRDQGRGRALAGLVSIRTGARSEFVPWTPRFRMPAGTEIVVNATSVGLFPAVGDAIDVDLDSLASVHLVADVIPNPPRTRLLTEAAARGCLTLDGLGMLVNQGAVAMRLWTGVDPDRGVMRATLAEIFG